MANESITCCNCGCVIDQNDVDEITLVDDDYVCKDCLSDYFCCCDDCNRLVHQDNIYFVDSFEERTICENCFERNYFRCDSCEEIYHNSYYGGDGCCENCFDNRNEFLHDYDYKPKPIFYGDKSDLFFGIELEIENKNGDIGDVIDNLPDFVYAKADGSLDDGLEIVSHPTTWSWLKENREKWDEILKLRDAGFLSYQTSTCGMHVHLSRKAFGALHLYKFLKLFFENRDFVLLVSRRKIKSLNQWASLETDENLVYKVKKGNDHTKRYTAINLENSTTVEIRIFRGTLSLVGFWRNLEFCKAAYDYTKNESTKDISAYNFCAFIRSNQKEYPDLFDFIQENQICV